MFRTILVPLDGSSLAEQALEPACRIAEKFDSALLLLRIVPQERIAPALPLLATRPGVEAPAPAPRPVMDEAAAYLSSLTLPSAIRSVSSQVLAGAPPELIVATAEAGEVDLIVMSTHGRTGLVRLLYGSVAEAVLRGASVPVLLVPSRAVTEKVSSPATPTLRPAGGSAA
ncbi:MAG: universal stress protein [Anaerolineales bacterium]|nr:universal stress protein [Anaerolineales bacterium]